MSKFLLSLALALIVGAAYRILRDEAGAKFVAQARPR